MRKVSVNLLLLLLFLDLHVYAMKINDMCSKNKSSLEVDFNHLDSKHPTLSMWIVTEPNIILPYLNDVALECSKKYFPNYG